MSDSNSEESGAAAARNLYNRRFAETGRDVRTVGWGTLDSQQLRFSVLFGGINFQGAHIVDLGSGLGDLVPWLRARAGEDFTYQGFDVADRLVADAAARFASDKISFRCADIASLDVPACDIAVCSGAFSYRPAWTHRSAMRVLGRMSRRSRVAAVANFLTDRVDYQEAKNLHYSPEETLKFALSVTPSVVLQTGYGLPEFSVQLRTAPMPR